MLSKLRLDLAKQKKWKKTKENNNNEVFLQYLLAVKLSILAVFFSFSVTSFTHFSWLENANLAPWNDGFQNKQRKALEMILLFKAFHIFIGQSSTWNQTQPFTFWKIYRVKTYVFEGIQSVLSFNIKEWLMKGLYRFNQNKPSGA